MSRLDVHPMPGKGLGGYILDVQADRTVVPLLREDTAPKPISELNPVFETHGERHVMVTQAIASILGRELKRAMASLAEQHDRVIRALDTLLLEF